MALVLLAIVPTSLSARTRRCRVYGCRTVVVCKAYTKLKKRTVNNNTQKTNPPTVDTQQNKPQGSINSQKLLIAKNNLKAVPQNEKNTYVKRLLARRDFYNAEADMASFIEKMKKGNVAFKNETNQTATIVLSLKDKNDAQAKLKKQRVRIKPHEFYILSDKQNSLTHVKLLEENYFLNPKWTFDSQLQLSIERKQDRFFLHQYHDFAFRSKPFTEQEIEAAQPEKKVFQQEFNGHLNYMDNVFQAEGLSLKSIDEQRQSLYKRNNIAQLLKNDSSTMDRYENKIPCITHKIWVTSDEHPIEIPQHYIKWYENSIKHNPTSEGWTHYLWIEKKTKLPELVKKMANHPNIKIMELDTDLPETLITGDAYRKAIQNKQFGKASDILRLEILNQFGGWYLDTDLELYQSLKPYCKTYDMVVALEPMSVILCNACIGSRPSHPVIIKGLELINRNLDTPNSPDYIKNNPDKGWSTIIETGPVLLTLAFAKAGGKIGETDIVLPPMLIYPTPVNEYPRKQVIKPNEPKPAESICGHYWETAWMRKEFGSEG